MTLYKGSNVECCPRGAAKVTEDNCVWHPAAPRHTMVPPPPQLKKAQVGAASVLQCYAVLCRAMLSNSQQLAYAVLCRVMLNNAELCMHCYAVLCKCKTEQCRAMLSYTGQCRAAIQCYTEQCKQFRCSAVQCR